MPHRDRLNSLPDNGGIFPHQQHHPRVTPMKRILFTIATLLPALPAALHAAQAPAHSQPNVLFILADDKY
jgi:hypothetical protein